MLIPRTIKLVDVEHILASDSVKEMACPEYSDVYSVPARLGKGQGAKEIGHNLMREQPKFGHNLVRKRHKIVHSLVWSMKTWAQIYKHKYFYIGCLKTQQQLHFVNGEKKKC